MEAAHCGFQVAMKLNLLAMYSLRIDLTTAGNVRGSGVKCTGSRSTGKVSSNYRSKSWGHNVKVLGLEPGLEAPEKNVFFFS